MKTLFLIRHAKSDWGDDDLSDIDRPLNKRGYRDAHTMSALLKEKKMIPDLIITSPAIRAVSTALIFCRNFNLSVQDIVINPNLYGSGLKHYINCIAQIDNRYNNIMLFGHNPTITELANSLSSAFSQTVPTCGVIAIHESKNFDDWKSFNGKNGELFFYDFPKNHKDAN